MSKPYIFCEVSLKAHRPFFIVKLLWINFYHLAILLNSEFPVNSLQNLKIICNFVFLLVFGGAPSASLTYFLSILGTAMCLRPLNGGFCSQTMAMQRWCRFRVAVERMALAQKVTSISGWHPPKAYPLCGEKDYNPPCSSLSTFGVLFVTLLAPSSIHPSARLIQNQIFVSL